MATLTGRSPKDTYGDLLQVSNANDGVDSTLRFVSDGKGTNSSLKISSASAQFTGTLTSTGLLTTTAGIVSGSDIKSDTDSTDDLGSTGVRWANLWVDNITMGGTIAGAVATFSSTMTVTGLTTATGGIFTSGTIIFEGATADAHETTLTVVDPTADRTVSLPNATDTLVGKATTDTLTNKTLTSPVLNTGLSGTAFLDEDNMASNSATKAASQQSIKAYVDAQVDTADTLSEILAIGNTTGGTDVSVSTDDKVQFRDAAIYINSSTDGQLDIVADTEIQIAATTIDINGAVALNGALTGITDITASGVITGGTVEATTDTAAGDNAAMGYTAAEGLILTGQGSSNDVTIKNDADATVMSIATGTTNATFAGDVTVTDMLNIGDGTARARLVFTSGDTTPDVSTGDFWLANNSGATSITNFDGGSTGSVIYVVANNANTTLVDSGTSSGISLLGGANYTMAQYEGKTFVQNGTDWWIEVGGKNDTFAGAVSVKTSGVPTLAGGTPYGLLVKSGGANSNGTYQGSIGFTESSGGNVRAAIMSKQTGADNDQNGLAFMTHPSASNVDGAIALLLEHDMNATFGGTVLINSGSTNSLITSAGSSSAAAVANFDDIRIDSSLHAGLQFSGGSTGELQISFGDAGDPNAGRINYQNSTNEMHFYTNGSLAFDLDASQNATFAGALVQSYSGTTEAVGITGTGSGGAYIKLLESGYKAWYMGIDNASTTFKIRPNSLGTASAFEIDNSNNATFTGTTNVGTYATGGGTGGLEINPLGYILHSRTTTDTAGHIEFHNPNGLVGSVSTNGSSTAFNTSSDYRLKENVVTDWDATTRLKQLKPSRFNFIVDADTTVDGFLAHEAQAVVPECVIGLKDAMKDEEYEVSAATGEVFTPAIEEVTTQSQVMETVETGSYVNLAGETIVETEQRGVTTETTETVVQRQDIDGVSTEVEVEVTTQVPTMETVITTAAVAETVHSTDVVQPETLAEGQQWRETTAQVMATRSVPDHQGIDQSKLVPLLVKTIQELEARITTLEA